VRSHCGESMYQSSPQRVLVVSPEAGRLDAMRKVKGLAWETIYAADSARALELLQCDPIDVVLADRELRGPTNGEALLRMVRDLSPDTALMAIEARAIAATDKKSLALLAVDRGAQAPVVAAMFERAYRIHKLLTNPQTAKVVGALGELPSVPETYWELSRVTAKPNCTVAEVAAIVQSDPALSVKVLQMVNSAFFGLSRRVSSIAQAVSYLGLELLKGLVLNAHVFAAIDASHTKGFSLERFQLYSVRCARLARKFVGESKLGDDAFTAAIVHDIGELVLAMQHPDKYSQVVAQSVDSGRPADELEREIIGASHAEAGAVTLASCGIPFSVVECVAFHHHPSLVSGGPREVLAAVHAADALIGILTCGDPESRLDVAFLESAGVGHRVEEWEKWAQDEVATWES